MKHKLTIGNFLKYLAKIETGLLVNIAFNKDMDGKFAAGFIKIMDTSAFVLGYWDERDSMLKVWQAFPEEISARTGNKLRAEIEAVLKEYGRFDSGAEYIFLCDDEGEPPPAYHVFAAYRETDKLPLAEHLKALAKEM